jgi:tRNA-dihydrouridine synthase
MLVKSDIKRFVNMKIRGLIDKLNLEIDNFSEADLDLEIESITIHTKDENKGFKAYIIYEAIHNNEATHKRKDNLETFGYSFEVGV